MSLGGASIPQTLTLEQKKAHVWSMCRTIPGYDPSIWRMDCNDAVIRWSDHGNRQSDYGWEVDHIIPVVVGGGDHAMNLRALHWRTNATAGGVLGGLAALGRGGLGGNR